MPVSINDSQAKAAQFIEGVGGSNYETLQLQGTQKLLFDLAAQFALDAQDNLNKKEAVATGALSDSIIPLPLKVMGMKLQADVKVLDYYKFIDRGVRGTETGDGEFAFKNNKVGRKMMLSIRKWLIKEGIKQRATKKYKSITRKEESRKKITDTSTATAYAIATSVKKKGINKTHFWTAAKNELERNIKTSLGKTLKIDIIESLKK